MNNKIILASRSGVRKEILNKNGIECEVIISNIDEDPVKVSLIKAKATPEIISKKLAELKANKISKKNPNKLVLGADSVVDLGSELIETRKNHTMKKSNGKFVTQYADENELREHYEIIKEIDKASDGRCIWNISKF